jgi:hypothetical protein
MNDRTLKTETFALTVLMNEAFLPLRGKWKVTIRVNHREMEVVQVIQNVY